MKRDRNRIKLSERLNDFSWNYAEQSNKVARNGGSVVTVDGVKYMSNLYNHKAAEAIKDEDPKFSKFDNEIDLSNEFTYMKSR